MNEDLICPECGSRNKLGSSTCENCGCEIAFRRHTGMIIFLIVIGILSLLIFGRVLLTQ